MINSFFKWLTKNKTFLGVIVFLITSFHVVISFFLTINLQRQLALKPLMVEFPITVDAAFYVFPDFIILKGVKITNVVGAKNEFLNIASLRLNISLKESLKAKQWVVSHIGISNPIVDAPGFMEFLRHKREFLLRVLDRMPLAKVRIAFKNVQSRTDPDKQGLFRSSAILQLNEHDYFLEGKCQRQDTSGIFFREAPIVTFQSKGAWLKDGKFFVDHLTLRSELYNARFSGDYMDQKLRFNGFVFLDDWMKKSGIERNFYDKKVESLKKKLHELFKPARPADDIFKAQKNVVEIDGQVGISWDRVDVDRVQFKINHVPLEMTGSLDWDQELRVKAILYYLNRPDDKGIVSLFKNAKIIFEGQKTPSDFKSDVVFEADLKQRNKRFWPEKLLLKVKDLTFRKEYQPVYYVSFKEAESQLYVKDKPYFIKLNNFNSTTSLYLSTLWISEVEFKAFEGQIKERIWIDLKDAIPRVNAKCSIVDLNARILEEGFRNAWHVDGLLSAKAFVHLRPEFRVRGIAKLREGVLRDFEFFKWLAETFDLEDLRSISFDRAQGFLKADEESFGFSDIVLGSKDLSITGDYFIKAGGLVMSQLKFSIDKEVLGTSRKLRSIMGLFEEEQNRFDFDFQLSGRLDSLNFQWLANDVKNKIQEWMPDFIERRIDKQIDNDINPKGEDF